MRVAFVIPFRDKGTDPCRPANLARVIEHLKVVGFRCEIIVSDDGREGDAPFNRSAAFNRGLEQTEADLIVWHESDMLVPPQQLAAACTLAATDPGLVIPFTDYVATTPVGADWIRGGNHPRITESDISAVMPNGASIGAIGVTSRTTINAIGRWDECFEGHAYDDDAMLRAFEVCCGPRRYVSGSAIHLWHVPGAGPTPGGADGGASVGEKAATERNRLRLARYQAATTPEEIRELTAGADVLQRA